jgi:hypothetical protein
MDVATMKWDGDLIFAVLGNLVADGHHAVADRLLARLDVDQLDLDTCISALAATCGKNNTTRLPSRAAFALAVEAKAKREYPSNVEALLVGLR